MTITKEPVELVKNFKHSMQTPLATIKAGTSGIKNFLPHLITAYQLAFEAGLIKEKIQPRHVELLTKALNNIETAAEDIREYTEVFSRDFSATRSS